MGSKGFAILGSSTPAGQNRGMFPHPGTMIDTALAILERGRGKQSPRHSKTSDDSELQEWNYGRSRRWTELPPSSMQQGSTFTGDRSDEMYPTTARDLMGIARVEEASRIPTSASLDFFQFPNKQAGSLNGSESYHGPPAANTAFSNPQAAVLYKTNILYETGPSRPESSTSSYAVPPPTEALPAVPADGRPPSESPIRSNFTGVTSASRSVSPRRATTTTATSVSPSFFKRTSGVRLSSPRSVSPLRQDSRGGESSPSAQMAGFGLTPASQSETWTIGGAGQVGTSSGTSEGLFASSGYGAGNGPNAVPGPSGSPFVPFPREAMRIPPIRRTRGRDEMSPEHQLREKERHRLSKRIVQLAMASPGPAVSESSSADTHEVLEMYEGVASKPSGAPPHEGSHPPVSIRPENIRKDSTAATTETHHTRLSTKSYPYAGLIALHAPTARPLSVSSKAKSQVSLGPLSSSAETDYGNPFGAQGRRASGAVSFSSSQYLYGYGSPNLDDESVRGRSLSRRSSLSALSVDPTASPGWQRNPSWSHGSSGRAGARASFGPTNRAEAAQRAAALIQLTSGMRRDR
jgi:hypothetical protein